MATMATFIQPSSSCSSLSSFDLHSCSESPYISTFFSTPIHLYPSKRSPHSRHGSLATPRKQAFSASDMWERGYPRKCAKTSNPKLQRSVTMPNTPSSTRQKRRSRSQDASEFRTISRSSRRTRPSLERLLDKPLPSLPTEEASPVLQSTSLKRMVSLSAVQTRPFLRHVKQNSVSSTTSTSSDSSSLPSIFDDKALDTPLSEGEVDLNFRKDKYSPKSYFRNVGGMKYHPYSLEDAPYMQSYDRIQLANDRASERLLRRLTPNGSPTFHDYGHKPPSNVLDLGCGQGGWIIQAALAWKGHGTKFTGFELMEVVSPDLDANLAKNITWVRGNFIKYELPFADRTFDFVRMANLSLAIPFESWRPLIREVYRVLTPAGRLELIDDHIFFPYHKPRTSTSSSRTITPRPSADPLSSFDDDDITLTDKRLPSLPVDVDTEWEDQAADSAGLETMFQHMLEKDFRVHSHPADFSEEILRSIFGRPNAKKSKSFHLALAPAEDDSESSPIYESPTESKKTWIPTIEWDRKDKKRDKTIIATVTTTTTITSGTNSTPTGTTVSCGEEPVFTLPTTRVPESISAKAAARLGISRAPRLPVANSKAAMRLGITTTLRRRPAQSPGLVLYPSTFLQMEPAELEMHACKHVHTLLGCKSALSQFVRDFKDDEGVPLVDDQELNDLLWSYECFRRSRFNWPSQLPGQKCFTLSEAFRESEEDQKPGPFYRWGGPSHTNHLSGPSSAHSSLPTSITSHYKFEDLTHVRTLHVFHAVKTDNHSKRF